MSLHNWVPKKIFLTRGTGVNREKLTSFELALREAGIASLNLITVSSILPPNCEFVDREVGVKLLNPGQIVPIVMARSESQKLGDKNIASRKYHDLLTFDITGHDQENIQVSLR